jgi:hypothetical protein
MRQGIRASQSFNATSQSMMMSSCVIFSMVRLVKTTRQQQAMRHVLRLKGAAANAGEMRAAAAGGTGVVV